jgi:hypothetical protein
MATPDEIERRVEDADTARTARRAATARRVGDLARRRASVAEQLDDIERELGDVLADAGDVIEIVELAQFTDLKPADLTRWLSGHKATRTRRKKAPAGTSVPNSDANNGQPGMAIPASEPALRTQAPNRAAATPERVSAPAT